MNKCGSSPSSFVNGDGKGSRLDEERKSEENGCFGRDLSRMGRYLAVSTHKHESMRDLAGEAADAMDLAASGNDSLGRYSR